jgi:hypothetical protein
MRHQLSAPELVISECSSRYLVSFKIRVCCPEIFVLIIILRQKIMDPPPHAFHGQENTHLELIHNTRKNLLFILGIEQLFEA